MSADAEIHKTAGESVKRKLSDKGSEFTPPEKKKRSSSDFFASSVSSGAGVAAPLQNDSSDYGRILSRSRDYGGDEEVTQVTNDLQSSTVLDFLQEDLRSLSQILRSLRLPLGSGCIHRNCGVAVVTPSKQRSVRVSAKYGETITINVRNESGKRNEYFLVLPDGSEMRFIWVTAGGEGALEEGAFFHEFAGPIERAHDIDPGAAIRVSQIDRCGFPAKSLNKYFVVIVKRNDLYCISSPLKICRTSRQIRGKELIEVASSAKARSFDVSSPEPYSPPLMVTDPADVLYALEGPSPSSVYVFAKGLSFSPGDSLPVIPPPLIITSQGSWYSIHPEYPHVWCHWKVRYSSPGLVLDPGREMTGDGHLFCRPVLADEELLLHLVVDYTDGTHAQYETWFSASGVRPGC